MHGRSRMTEEPRIPTMPGRKTPGFHRPRRRWRREGELLQPLFHRLKAARTIKAEKGGQPVVAGAGSGCGLRGECTQLHAIQSIGVETTGIWHNAMIRTQASKQAGKQATQASRAKQASKAKRSEQAKQSRQAKQDCMQNKGAALQQQWENTKASQPGRRYS